MAKNHKKLKVIMSVLLLLYTASMIVIAVLPQVSGFNLVEGADKIVHFIEFFIFSILLLSTLSLDNVEEFYLIALIVILVVILVSELVQIPIIGRTFSVKDMMADLAGAAVGYILFSGVRKEWKYLKQLWSG